MSPVRERRGRELFALVRPVLSGAAAVLGLVPRPICAVILVLLRYVPGLPGVGLRYVLVKRLAASCGDNVAIYEGCYLKDLQNLHLGSNISIREMCYIAASGGITIEDDVSFAHGCTVLTEEHDHRHAGPLRSVPIAYAPVRIERNVWVGCAVQVLAGVTIGHDSAVGAGSVVTRDIEPHVVAAGVPARTLKPREIVAS